MNQLYDPIRKAWVAATPEERVRQALIGQMVEELGYPPGLIAVEKELRRLPHLIGKKVPSRRADILCFGKEVHPDHPLYPLLLIECKAIPLSAKELNQVVGYNYYVQAPVVAVVNASEMQVAWTNGQLGSQLPLYDELAEIRFSGQTPPVHHT